jgi:hypothetical protein
LKSSRAKFLRKKIYFLEMSLIKDLVMMMMMMLAITTTATANSIQDAEHVQDTMLHQHQHQHQYQHHHLISALQFGVTSFQESLHAVGGETVKMMQSDHGLQRQLHALANSTLDQLAVIHSEAQALTAAAASQRVNVVRRQMWNASEPVLATDTTRGDHDIKLMDELEGNTATAVHHHVSSFDMFMTHALKTFGDQEYQDIQQSVIHYKLSALADSVSGKIHGMSNSFDALRELGHEGKLQRRHGVRTPEQKLIFGLYAVAIIIVNFLSTIAFFMGGWGGIMAGIVLIVFSIYLLHKASKV